MKTKITWLVILALVAALAYALFAKSSGSKPTAVQGNLGPGVVVENGTQVILISAKGGYSPRSVTAKAGVPTVLRVKTENTYDCSIALNVPKLKFRQVLQPTGTVDIPVSASQAQGTLQGVCSMGMYSFAVNFK